MSNARNLANLLSPSGDLTVDTSTLKVDATNNSVGIGITNPASYNIHADELVVGGTDGNRGITIVGGDDDYSILNLNRYSNTSATPNGALEYNHTDNQMYIKAGGNHCLQLNSNGSVNKTNQPLWSAIRASTRMMASTGYTMTNVNTIEFSNYENVGNHVSSNIFTCPVDGKYLCNVWGMSYSTTDGWVAIYTYLNSTAKITCYNDIHTAWQTFGSSIVLGASANDTIKFGVQAQNSDAKWHEGNYGGAVVTLLT